jgi:CelD/BcsL family acetyltransferase involved in cellulose biosynthesis
MGATVRVLVTLDEFATLREEWQELLRSSQTDNPFLTWEWLHAWWTHFGTSDRLRLIVVRSGGRLIAIAPLHLVASPLYWFSRLEFLGTGEAGSDYLDFIVRHGAEAEALACIADFLISHRLTLRLAHLPPASHAAQLARHLTDAGWTASSAEDGVCPIVKLDGHTFESFLGSLGASHRANVRRRLRGIAREFDVRFETVTGDTERREMLDALASFHARRYHGRGGSTAFSTPTVRAFHEQATRSALDCGWLRMYALRLDGHLAAVMYGFHYGGRFYFYQHGHDDRYASHSVGLILMARTVGAAIEEGALEFDMLWGTESYKALWTREARLLQRVDLFPLRVGEIVYRHAADVRRGVSQIARRMLALRSPGAARVS